MNLFLNLINLLIYFFKKNNLTKIINKNVVKNKLKINCSKIYQ